MHASLRFCLPLVLLVLAACSSNGDESPASSSAKPVADSPVMVANAEFARLKAQGPEATAREITKLEYPLTRDLMKAAGLDAALGGEAKADAALSALFMDYERKARALQAELPKAFMPTHEGGGGSMGAEGWGGAAASSVLGGAQAETASRAWENGVDRGENTGHAESSFGDKMSVDWTADSATMTTEVEGGIPGGLQGKVKTTVSLKTCPDAEGKVVAEFESASTLAVGGASADTKVKSRVTAFVDDDANLIDDKLDSDSNAQRSTSSGAHVDASDDMSTQTGKFGGRTNSLGGGATDADGKLAQGMASMGRFAARQAILAAQKAWESGKCVDLKVRSDPAKRTGAKPNTAYTLIAEPRAKGDGAPTRGTVKATLSGEHMLNPRDKKVPADAQFDYQNPEKKDQSATIDFEARSKRGVGKASLQFDTKKGGYRIDISGVGTKTSGSACHVKPITTCDITKPFTGEFCGGTLSHTPTGDKGGTFSLRIAGNGGSFEQSGAYTLSGPEERMIASYASTKICAKAAGHTFCMPPRTISTTWTKINNCDE